MRFPPLFYQEIENIKLIFKAWWNESILEHHKKLYDFTILEFDSESCKYFNELYLIKTADAKLGPISPKKTHAISRFYAGKLPAPISPNVPIFCFKITLWSS